MITSAAFFVSALLLQMTETSEPPAGKAGPALPKVAELAKSARGDLQQKAALAPAEGASSAGKRNARFGAGPEGAEADRHLKAWINHHQFQPPHHVPK